MMFSQLIDFLFKTITRILRVDNLWIYSLSELKSTPLSRDIAY